MKKIKFLLMLVPLLVVSVASCGKKNETNSNQLPQLASGTYEVNKVAFDNEYGKLEVDSIIVNDSLPYEIVLKVENKNDIPANFIIKNIAVDGYASDINFTSINTLANETVNYNLKIYETLTKMIDEIKFHVNISDQNFSSIYNGIYSVFPTGKTVETVQYDARQTTSTEKVIIDNEYCNLVLLSSEYDKLNKATAIDYYLENRNNEYDAFFKLDNFIINVDKNCDYWTGDNLLPNTRMYGRIYLFDSTLDAISISKVNSVKFTIYQYFDNTTSDDNLIYSCPDCTYNVSVKKATQSFHSTTTAK